MAAPEPGHPDVAPPIPKQPRQRKKPTQAAQLFGRGYLILQGCSAVLMAIAAMSIAVSQTIDYLAQVDLLDNQAIIIEGITATLERPGALAPTVQPATAASAELDLVPSLQPAVPPDVQAAVVPPQGIDLNALFVGDDFTPGDKVAVCFNFFDNEFNIRARKMETHLHSLIQQRHRQR